MEVAPYRSFAEFSGDDRSLLEAARRVAGHAFNPVSRFEVGAAIRTTAGDVYLGTFLESAALPLGVCAEPAALLAALADGVRSVAAVAVVGGDPAAPGCGLPVTPCGGCRQRINDVTGGSATNVRVICSDLGLRQVLDTRITDLLPCAFDPAMLPESAWRPPVRRRDAAARGKPREDSHLRATRLAGPGGKPTTRLGQARAAGTPRLRVFVAAQDTP